MLAYMYPVTYNWKCFFNFFASLASSNCTYNDSVIQRPTSFTPKTPAPWIIFCLLSTGILFKENTFTEDGEWLVLSKICSITTYVNNAVILWWGIMLSHLHSFAYCCFRLYLITIFALTLIKHLISTSHTNQVRDFIIIQFLVPLHCSLYLGTPAHDIMCIQHNSHILSTI